MTEPHSPCPGDRELERINYSDGMLLTSTDFETEQAYFLDKARAHNQLHGWGTVCGLAVEPTQPPSTSVLVQPGLAIDRCGREVVLTRTTPLDIVDAASGIGSRESVSVVIEYDEKECSPTQGAGHDGPHSQPTRVRETPRLSVYRDPAEVSPSSPPMTSGVVPCPDRQNPTLTLAGIHLQNLGPITAERIDNSQRRIIPLCREAIHDAMRDTDFGPITAREVDALQRRTATLTAAVAVLAVGVMTSLLRGQRGG